MSTETQFRFGPFRFEPRNSILWRGHKPIHLPPLTCSVLELLIDRAGKVVTKRDFEDEVWKVKEQVSLAFQINLLRKKLGKEHRKFIKTVHKRGYRFEGQVETDVIAVEEKNNAIEIVVDETPRKSLAVIPVRGLDNLVSDLQDGVTTALTAKLGEINEIVVTPQRTVRQFTERIGEPLQVGRELKVDAIVDGNIEDVDGRIQGAIQLVRISDGKQLWRRSVDVEFKDIFKLHTSLALEIAGQLTQVTAQERVRLSKQETQIPEAYNNYVQGRKLWNLRTDDGLTMAIDCFTTAVKLDPKYAMALAGLADCYNIRSYYCGVKPRHTFPIALQYAEKALSLDPELAEAHNARAYAISRCYWTWDEADAEYKRAISLKPNYATAHQWYAEFLTAMGRFDEAIKEAEIALQLDPHSPIVNATRGTILYFSRQYDAAISQYRETIARNPDFIRTHFRLARALVQQEKFKEAITECKKGLKLMRNKTRELSQLAHVYAVAGQRKQALEILNELHDSATQQYISEYNLAIVYAGLKDHERALKMLENAFFSRDPWIEHLNVDPRLDALRSDDRFKRLLQHVHLPDKPQVS